MIIVGGAGFVGSHFVDALLADDATERVDAELRAGRLEHLRAELDAVGRAETRLAAGTYGRSVESGAAIPDERLEAYPTAERTVEEESALERGRR